MQKSNKETPNQFLCRLTDEKVRVLLKWGTIYEGEYTCTDKYMNIILRNAIEIKNGCREEVGDTCIRCNNIKIIEEIANPPE